MKRLLLLVFGFTLLAVSPVVFATDAVPPAWQQFHDAGEQALEQKEYEQAVGAFTRAVGVAQSRFENKAPDSVGLLARSYNDLGVAYLSNNQPELAEGSFEKSLSLYNAIFKASADGRMHPYMKTVLLNLATIYQQQGRFDDLDALFSDYIPTQKASLDNDQTDLALAIYALANKYMLKGRYAEATALYKRLLSWMPPKPTADDELYKLRPEIIRRLADMGTEIPVAVGSPVAEVAPIRAAQQVETTAAIQPERKPDALPSGRKPMPSDEVFQKFLAGLDQKIKQYWYPNDYYKHVPVTVLMTLDKKGTLVEYHLKEPTGFHPADQAALEAVRNAAPFMPVPSEYGREFLLVEFKFN